MRRPIASKSERSGTGVDMANLSKVVCHGESDKSRFGNPPQESNFQRLGINRFVLGAVPALRHAHHPLPLTAKCVIRDGGLFRMDLWVGLGPPFGGCCIGDFKMR